MTVRHQPIFFTMMRTILIICLFFNTFSTFAQRHDNYWLSGRAGWEPGPTGDGFGLTGMYFDTAYQPVFVNREELFSNFDMAKSIICDSSGNLLMYCNSENIYNNYNEIMENGGDLVQDENCEFGCRHIQGTIMLPYPNHPNQYWVFSTKIDFLGAGAWIIFSHLYANLVDMEKNNGHGKVIIRKELVVQDTLSGSKITATKHANERDWWLLAVKDGSTQYLRFLIDPTGIHNMGNISAGIYEVNPLSFATFSPDGTKYARIDHTYTNMPAHLSVFGFDRCSGTLNYLGTDTVPDPSFSAGIAFSHDSRYLWMSKPDGLYQYDLQDPDFLNTAAFIPYLPIIYDFHIAQLGPDGRIYLNQGSSIMSLPYINHPYRPAEQADCNLEGYSLLTYCDYSLPNQPWFRLGPVDGSACDTLGLDNHPLCAWRYELEDSLAQPLTVTFTDLSTYEPTTWQWYFGDGTTSTERYPQHTYDSMGIYTACLVVSNAYSSDTVCHVINLGVVSSTQSATDPNSSIRVYPNPASTALQLHFGQAVASETVFQLFDLSGRSVLQQRIAEGVQSIQVDLPNVQDGLYFYRVVDQAGNHQSGKIGIIR
jgi:hypothetical protein